MKGTLDEAFCRTVNDTLRLHAAAAPLSLVARRQLAAVLAERAANAQPAASLPETELERPPARVGVDGSLVGSGSITTASSTSSGEAPGRYSPKRSVTAGRSFDKGANRHGTATLLRAAAALA